MTRHRAVKCVLFDMDGLLLDTERLYTQGTQDILSQYGHNYDWEFKTKLMGKRTDEVARMIIDHYNLPIEPDQWVQLSTEQYHKMFPNVKSLPGVTKLVHHLVKSKVPISVATSSSTSSFKLKTVNHSGLFSLFDQIVLGDDDRVLKAKPAPDIFLVAASQFSDKGVEPRDCLVVEDAPLGVEAGKAAGMQVLMIPDDRMAQIHKENATQSLSSLHDFDPSVFGLPSYPYTPVTHVIFDMDGLLLNTQEMYSKVGGALLASHGKTSDWEFKMKVIGRKAEEAAAMIVEHYGLPYTGPEYLTLHESKLHSLFPTCDLLPGVEKLVKHLKDNNIPMCVATSSSRRVLDIKISMKHKQFFSQFSHIVTGCDSRLKTAKPSPEIYQLAASSFPVDKGPVSPASCLVFEDAPNGVTASLAAGMQVVMIPDCRVKKEYLLPATQVLSSMEDFLPQDFGLPPFP